MKKCINLAKKGNRRTYTDSPSGNNMTINCAVGVDSLQQLLLRECELSEIRIIHPLLSCYHVKLLSSPL